MQRRLFLQKLLITSVGLGTFGLTSCKKAPDAQHNQTKNDAITPSHTAQNDLFYQFGFQEGQQTFARIYPAGPPAEVMLFALAPQSMIGWSAKKSKKALQMLPSEYQHFQELGGINGRGTTVSFERLLQENIELIIDLGTINDTYISTAQRTSEQLNLPYILVNGKLEKTPEQIQLLGSIIASQLTDNLYQQANKALDFAKQFAKHHQSSLSVYYARGSQGLETGRQGSIHTEVIDLLGLDNVANALGVGGLAKVSIEQLLAWQPDIILTQDENFFYDLTHLDKLGIWSSLQAVKNQQVYLLPKVPYGWMDGPPSINRLLGIYLLAAIIDDKPMFYYKDDIKNLYQALYHKTLTDNDIQNLAIR